MKVDKTKWEHNLISDCIKTVKVKDAIQKKDYQQYGKYPIISQEKDFISGYCDTIENLNSIGEVVIFGDHTRVLKYVDFDFCVGADGVKVFQSSSDIRAKYLFYFLKWADIPSNGYSRHFKFLKELTISYPSLLNQQAIVVELDALQAMIDGYKAQIADLDTLAQSIFLDTFGDPVSNPKGWNENQLTNVVTEITSSKRIFANEYVNDGIPFYRIKEIIEKCHQIPLSLELYISKERYNEIKDQFGIPQVNDLLVTAVGSIGEIWVVNTDSPFYFKDGNVIWIKMSSLVDAIYLKYTLSSKIAHLKEKLANGSAYAALTIIKLKGVSIPYPPIALQQYFASKVEAIEKQKELLRQQLADAETLMAERMQYYFS